MIMKNNFLSMIKTNFWIRESRLIKFDFFYTLVLLLHSYNKSSPYLA